MENGVVLKVNGLTLTKVHQFDARLFLYFYKHSFNVFHKDNGEARQVYDIWPLRGSFRICVFKVTT